MAVAPAAAQTLRLTDSSATTLRDGSYANTNLSKATVLETRVGSKGYTRRIQLKFDTHNTIPAGTPVASAALTLTVAGGNAETRQLTAYRGSYSYNEWQATWNARKSGVYWPKPGGDVSEPVGRQTVTNSAGSKVTFDVTSVVQKIVNGSYNSSSRYARFLLADTGGASRQSYKQYYSDEAGDVSVRPVLTITTGTTSSSSITSTSSTSTSTSTASSEALRLTDSSATTLRDGGYANTNFSKNTVIETRKGSAGYTRRIQLKFDTHNTIPQGTSIASAALTLTVAGGNAETRQLAAYRGSYSYNEWEATWKSRKRGLYWPSAGGDTSQVAARQNVTNAAGSKVTFDVTSAVQNIVNGTYGSSRYARFLIADTGGSSRSSYKQYHSDEAANVSVRPVLTITFGTGTTTTDPTPTTPTTSPSPSTSSATLKVLDWNIHHGFTATNVHAVDQQAAFIATTGAHVVSLNEVERYTGWGNEDQPARIASILKSKTGRTWYYKFAQRTGLAKGQGNLLLSVYPFESTGEYLLSSSRSVAQGTIIVNGRRINLFSTHLDASSSSVRSTQISQLTRWAAGFPESRIVAGDFNAWPGAGEISGMTSGQYDTWAEAMKLGTASAYPGNEAGNTRKSRIDYIFLSKGASNVVIKSSRVFDARHSSGVQLSDHRPLMTTFEIR